MYNVDLLMYRWRVSGSSPVADVSHVQCGSSHVQCGFLMHVSVAVWIFSCAVWVFVCTSVSTGGSSCSRIVDSSHVQVADVSLLMCRWQIFLMCCMICWRRLFECHFNICLPIASVLKSMFASNLLNCCASRQRYRF